MEQFIKQLLAVPPGHQPETAQLRALGEQMLALKLETQHYRVAIGSEELVHVLHEAASVCAACAPDLGRDRRLGLLGHPPDKPGIHAMNAGYGPYKLDLYVAKHHHALVSSISSKEIDFSPLH